MAIDDELSFSSEASATRMLFYQPLNGVNLFVEDIGKEYEYETIFKRLLGSQYNIEAIFPLGGKPAVIEHYKEFGPQTNDTPNYYIVDGDFDRYIRPDEMIIDEHLIYLEAYNIESYFLDENACLHFAKGHLKCLDSVVKSKINYPVWLSTIVNQAKKLFLCYCFLQKHHPQIENVSRSEYLFLDYKTGFERVDDSYEKYWASILEIDNDAVEKIKVLEEIYESLNGQNYFNLICGKFLLVSLQCFLRSILKTSFKTDDLRWYLINHFDISKLEYVKDRIFLSQNTPLLPK